MIDGKVLTAVLASVAAIAAAISGGGITAEQVKSNGVSAPAGTTFNGVTEFARSLIPGNLGLELFKPPEPDFDLSARVTVSDLQEKKLKIKEARFSADNFSSLSFEGRKVVSDESIDLYGFSGRFMPGENSSVIEGRVKGFESSGVNVSGGFPVNHELSSSVFRFEDVRRMKISFDSVEGVIDANSTQTRVDDTSFSVNSFSGDLVVYPGNNSVFMEGEVDRLEAGAVSLG